MNTITQTCENVKPQNENSRDFSQAEQELALVAQRLPEREWHQIASNILLGSSRCASAFLEKCGCEGVMAEHGIVTLKNAAHLYGVEKSYLSSVLSYRCIRHSRTPNLVFGNKSNPYLDSSVALAASVLMYYGKRVPEDPGVKGVLERLKETAYYPISKEDRKMKNQYEIRRVNVYAQGGVWHADGYLYNAETKEEERHLNKTLRMRTTQYSREEAKAKIPEIVSQWERQYCGESEPEQAPAASPAIPDKNIVRANSDTNEVTFTLDGFKEVLQEFAKTIVEELYKKEYPPVHTKRIVRKTVVVR